MVEPRTDSAGNNPDNSLRFGAILQRLSFDQQATIGKAIKKDNPQAGTEFLTKNQGKQVFPLLFSYLISNDQPNANKINFLSNIREALDLPTSSKLSEKISTNPDDFFNNLVRVCGREDLGYTPSPEARTYLDQIYKNFKIAIENDEYRTLAGKNIDIFKIGEKTCDGKQFLEAVITGVLDEKLPLEFRQTLAGTLLSMASSPGFPANDVFSSDASYQKTVTIKALVPEILGSGSPKDSRSQLESTKKELADTQEALKQKEKELRQKEAELAEEKKRVKNLQDLLKKARIRHPYAETPGKHENPFAVLGIPPTATEAEIKKAWKQLSNLYHPDLVWGLFEKGKVTEDPKAYALRILAQEKLKEINDAYDDLKLQGKVH